MSGFFQRAKKQLHIVQDMLSSAPAIINAVRAAVPEEVLAAVMTDEQKSNIASGALKLLTKKNGSMLASLCDPVTGKIVANVPLEALQLTPELSNALVGLSTQVQMTQIIHKIEAVQRSVDSIIKGQEDDRLAAADSCTQKYMQALTIGNPTLRQDSLLKIAMDAEDIRSALMRSFAARLQFIENQPQSTFMKLVSSDSPEKIDNCMEEIRIGLFAINETSKVEYLAYQELGEERAALQSMNHYGNFIEEQLVKKPELVDRLNSIDYKADNYWNKILPELGAQLRSLPSAENYLGIEESMQDDL